MTLQERQVFQKEQSIGLHKVNYEVFERAIKRYGFTGRLTEDSFKAIAKEYFNISPQTLDDKFTNEYKYLKCQKLFYQGNYEIEQLLYLGYVLCRHETPQKAVDSLWGLIDPDIKGMVRKQRLIEVLQNLVYYAMILPHDIQLIEPSIDPMYSIYIKRLKEEGEEFLKTAESIFPQYLYMENFANQIDIEKWNKSFIIREIICPQKNNNQKSIRQQQR
eukprot:403377301